ncbi:MAG: DUF5946 family protein [Dehalococcoidales bacterium]|nr:DUF5946 family protein [Dehalococcoidales bacterium]
MDASRLCPECGATWDEGQTCEDRFHQMLAWEWEDPRNLAVHHLMVLSYHLQHPHLYSPEGLSEAKQLLLDFLEHDVSPAEARRRNRAAVDSGRRQFKIEGTAASHGAYDPPVRWTMTAKDVVAGGRDRYCENVRACAASVAAALKVWERSASERGSR